MYFGSFPVIPYDSKGDLKFKDVTNLLRRVGIRTKLKSNALLYDTYNVKEGETPEMIAHILYGDSELHFVIMLINDITDRYHQWPMSLPQFQEFINDNFDNYNSFKDEVLLTAMKLQGSGWVYLSKNGQVKTTPNQTYKSDILMPIDMWEHSFSDYTKEGKECKKKYIQNMMRIINWDVINQRLA